MGRMWRVAECDHRSPRQGGTGDREAYLQGPGGHPHDQNGLCAALCTLRSLPSTLPASRAAMKPVPSPVRSHQEDAESEELSLFDGAGRRPAPRSHRCAAHPPAPTARRCRCLPLPAAAQTTPPTSWRPPTRCS